MLLPLVRSETQQEYDWVTGFVVGKDGLCSYLLTAFRHKEYDWVKGFINGKDDLCSYLSSALRYNRRTTVSRDLSVVRTTFALPSR